MRNLREKEHYHRLREKRDNEMEESGTDLHPTSLRPDRMWHAGEGEREGVGLHKPKFNKYLLSPAVLITPSSTTDL